MSLYREFRYRKLFQMTHEQYLDEPHRIVTWLLEMDSIINEVSNG